uniref:Amine oxidase domain-containing protein n=1 Tax=Octactis speculum TaxID=3111310 RepID=A0A7S2BBF6_9STRA
MRGSLNDEMLNDALASIALQEASPVLAVFFYCTGEAAAQWSDLRFNVGELRDNSVLSKIIVQPNEAKGCSVVLHSTTAFAQTNTGVYGSSSSAARVGDASSDSSREDTIIGKLLQALSEIPGMPTVAVAADNPNCGYGPLLHRWGNAFPNGNPLPEGLTLCPSSRVGFCGDYTETSARMGSIESALLSGTSVGVRIAQLAKTN